MKNRRSLYLTSALLSAALQFPALAQDAQKPAGKPSDAEMMAVMMQMAQPNENHKLLTDSVGTWAYKTKWWVSPGAPPMESTGTCVIKEAMDGRYTVSEHTGKMSSPGPDGKMMDLTFKGMGTEGFDNTKKKYVASWIDNMGTGIMSMEGTYDPDSKTLTYVGEFEPVPGVKTKMRQVVKLMEKNHHSMEFYEVRADKEVKMMEMDYTRS